MHVNNNNGPRIYKLSAFSNLVNSLKRLALMLLSSPLILRTLGSFNVFILLNGWICLHGVS